MAVSTGLAAPKMEEEAGAALEVDSTSFLSVSSPSVLEAASGAAAGTDRGLSCSLGEREGRVEVDGPAGQISQINRG